MNPEIVDYKRFVFSCCDQFDIGPYGWNQPMISLEKVLTSSSSYNLDNIIHGKQARNGYAIISAEHEDAPKKINDEQTEKLEEEIVKAGYSFKHALGGYTYDGGDDYTKEKSFVVFNFYRDGTKGDFKDLEKFALKMCNDFDQESVLIAAPGKVPVYKDSNGNVVSNEEHSSDKVSVNMKNPPAYTSFKTSKGTTEDDERKEWTLPDRYATMDIAWSSFVGTLVNHGITHLGNVNTTGNGHIRSRARGMITYW